MIMRPLVLLVFLLYTLKVQCFEGTSDKQSLLDWKAFYHKYFMLELDISGIRVPDHQEGYDRIIVVAEGLTHQDVIEVIQDHFEMFCMNSCLNNYYDYSTISVRGNEQTYAIRVRDTVSSGEQKKMATAVERITNRQTEPVINDITLLERLLFEMKFYDETKGHLDVEGFTVCGGTFYKKDSLALSPAVGWKTGRGDYYPPFLFITECYKDFTLDGYYSRNVITIMKEPDNTEPANRPAWYEIPILPDVMP